MESIHEVQRRPDQQEGGSEVEAKVFRLNRNLHRFIWMPVLDDDTGTANTTQDGQKTYDALDRRDTAES